MWTFCILNMFPFENHGFLTQNISNLAITHPVLVSILNNLDLYLPFFLFIIGGSVGGASFLFDKSWRSSPSFDGWTAISVPEISPVIFTLLFPSAWSLDSTEPWFLVLFVSKDFSESIRILDGGRLLVLFNSLRNSLIRFELD